MRPVKRRVGVRVLAAIGFVYRKFISQILRIYTIILSNPVNPVKPMSRLNLRNCSLLYQPKLLPDQEIENEWLKT
jgi:hypothetical protein